MGHKAIEQYSEWLSKFEQAAQIEDYAEAVGAWWKIENLR